MTGETLSRAGVAGVAGRASSRGLPARTLSEAILKKDNEFCTNEWQRDELTTDPAKQNGRIELAPALCKRRGGVPGMRG